MLDKWLEVYAKWPPMNQLVFCVIVVFGFVVFAAIAVYACSLIPYYMAVLMHGWPDVVRPVELDWSTVIRDLTAMVNKPEEPKQITDAKPATIIVETKMNKKKK